MTSIATSIGRENVFELPPWAQSFLAACTATGTIIGGFLFLRSGARRAIEQATAAAIEQKTAAEKSAGEAQLQELASLRSQVSEFQGQVKQLRDQVTGQTTLITSYVIALQERDLTIATLQRHVRDLESQLK